MNILKCDICGKIFKYNNSITKVHYKSVGRSITKYIPNKLRLYYKPIPFIDEYDDNLLALIDYDVCPSCANKITKFIDEEKAKYESADKSNA